MAMADQPCTSFDESEMQRSQDLALALEELRNLSPQLYSAADYCEASYLYSEQKKVVVDNLKDYSVKALVNVVDHLGTVASKLNDFLGQQTCEISASEIRVASVARRLHTCQEYSDQEGLRQQTLEKNYSRRHKHYILPNLDFQGKREDSLQFAADAVREDRQYQEVIDNTLKEASPNECGVSSVPSSDMSQESTKVKGKVPKNDSNLEANHAVRLEDGRHSWQAETGTLSLLLAAEAKTFAQKGPNSKDSFLQSAAEALFSQENTRSISSSSRSGPILSITHKAQKAGSSTPPNRSNKLVLNDARTLASLASFEHVGTRRSHSPSSKNFFRSLISRQRNGR